MAILQQDQIKLRGRLFTSTDLMIIKHCVAKYFDKGRTYISKEICRELDWKQPNGWLKDRACRDVLLRLSNLGIISLPPSRSTKRPVQVSSSPKQSKPKKKYLTSYSLEEFPTQVSLVFAKGNSEERLWNKLVEEHHYLGHKVIVGRCIKYLVVSENRVLAAIAFSSPAWRLGSRDSLLGCLGITPDDVLNVVINNSRFLVLPDANMKNLASFILAMATKAVAEDWEKYYSVKPLFVETFVQPSKFVGTCYKAANWHEVGVTKGYAKSGSSYHNSQEPKKIFLYGLNRRSRVMLRQALNKQKGCVHES